ncbi:glycosyltransferase family 39 protein [Floridanema evergladense]|uniref:Glycosyltransferase family 39 protein n=1 Tax=Floridaenema evergladense BLCC-F167 TaxID=3153639 RepID=A0ABV4WFG6_9CYAN
MENTYSLRKFVITVAIPIVTFWTVLFLFRYPLPHEDDLFFIGAAINLAKGGEFTNPLLEAWNSVFSSGKFYYHPPFHSFTLAAWLKLAGISTTSLLFFQYLCYNIFSLCLALLLRFYAFPRVTALCTTIIYAAWHCNPNPFQSSGFRHDALGMAYLALGLWLLTKDSWLRYFLGFCFLGIAVFTSPITSAYAISFGIAIIIINFINNKNNKNFPKYKYVTLRLLAFVAAICLVVILFLICINFDFHGFKSVFALHASYRRTSTIEAIPVFIKFITRYYGYILLLPTYILYILLSLGIYWKKDRINNWKLKILLVGSNIGIILNVLFYAGAIWFSFYFCWVGIVSIISVMFKERSKIRIYAFLVATLIFLSSQSLNILSLIEREYVTESQYQKIREVVLDKPKRKYAIDEIAARFVFDYKLPKNSIAWNFIKPAPDAYPISAKDKKPGTIWIVSKSKLGHYVPEMQPDYPRVEFMGRKFNSLPKKPFDVILIP